MTMYADIVFLTNAVIDYMLLFLTGHICRQPLRKRRLLFASLVGATYTVFLFFPPLSFAFTFLAKLLFSCLMIMLAFRWTKMWGFVRLLATFYAVSFFIGGGLMAAHAMLEEKSEVVDGIVVTHTGASGPPLTLWFLIIGFSLLWWGVRYGYYSVKASRQVDVQYVQLEVDIFGHTIACRGFIDTGNQLFDPLTRIPVTVMEAEVWKGILPERLLQRLEEEITAFELDMPEEESRWLERLRFIPYRTVSSQTGFLVAIRPDEVRVYANDKTYCINRMLIGLRAVRLSADRSYQAIVHPKGIEERYVIAS
ncbi:sporulation sigma-E factor-processing peptidase [Aneurinibacillus danicus]|uniref:Sporulation sigma-E factor-processing peptidase n=2 Tax=Aneurinibacillus group TaxID=85151 RepID=A0A511V1I0_9BACL|nr:sporulation sigma-E factor-processing peptidase [Aneurinibacillus danicus]